MVDLSPYPVVYAFSELIGAPFKNPGILWVGLPLILTLIIIELNFGARKEHGIKQALPNALVLLFVSLDMARVVFSRGEGFFSSLFSWPFFGTLVVFALAALVFYIDYKYGFPQKTMAGVSAHFPINVLAYSLLAIVYNQIAFGFATIVGIILLGALFWVMFFFVRRTENISHSSGRPGKFSWGSGNSREDDMREALDFSRPKKKVHIPSQMPKTDGKKGADENINLETGNLVWLKK
jgi:hypothetical protein